MAPLLGILLVSVTATLATSFGPIPTPTNPTGTFFSDGFNGVVKILCDALRSRDPLTRDACHGCFMRIPTIAQCKDSRKELTICVRTYLHDTPFQSCSPILEGIKAEGNGTTVCDFENCIRRKDKEILVEECTNSVLGKGSPVSTYIKTTACILAKLRCREEKASKQPWQANSPGSLQTLFVTEDMQLESGELYGGMVGGNRCGQNQPFERQALWDTCECRA